MTNLQEYFRAADTSPIVKVSVAESLSMLYHEQSKPGILPQRHSVTEAREADSSLVSKRFTHSRTYYTGVDRIDLVPYQNSRPRNADLFELLNSRRNTRNFEADYTITLPELTLLLQQSYGVSRRQKEKTAETGEFVGLRSVPSPGGLFPLELYVVSLRSHCPQGLYHFRPDRCELECLKPGNHQNLLCDIVRSEPYVSLPESGLVVITTGVIERMNVKYDESGYRSMLHESGFVTMTMTLIAESLGLGCSMAAGYDDDEVNSFLGVDGIYETVQNILILGKSTSAL